MIQEHHAAGNPAIRLIKATQGGHAPDLVEACRRFVTDPDATRATLEAVRAKPDLITLEDLLVVKGSRWDLPLALIDRARTNALLYDALVGFQRFRS